MRTREGKRVGWGQKLNRAAEKLKLERKCKTSCNFFTFMGIFQMFRNLTKECYSTGTGLFISEYQCNLSLMLVLT